MSAGLAAPAARVRAMTTAGLWRNESLTALLERWARERPHALAATDGATRYTWRALAQAVDVTHTERGCEFLLISSAVEMVG